MISFFNFQNLDKKYTVCGEFAVNAKWQIAIVLNHETGTMNFCYSDGFITHWGYYAGTFRYKTRHDEVVFEQYPTCPKYVGNAIQRATKLFIKK